MLLPHLRHRVWLLRAAQILFLIFFSTASLLSAHAATQQLVCSPCDIGFAAVAIGQSETRLIVLSNAGKTSITISAMSSSGSDVSVSGITFPATLAPAQSVTANITFRPTANGWSANTVAITSNASNPLLTIQVGGSGVKIAPVIASPASVSFGQITVGKSATVSVVVTNNLPWREKLYRTQVSGAGFSVSTVPLPMTLGGHQSVKLNVTFAPQNAGMVSGNVYVAGLGLSIPLSADGTSGGTGSTPGQLAISPATLSFGNVNVGSTSTKTLTFSATGGNVTVSSVSSSNSQFALPGTIFPLTVAAGTTVSVNVGFTPTQSGGMSGTLTFSDNGSPSQSTDSVGGTGVVPSFSVNLSWNASPSSVAGYNVYRGAAVAGPFSRLNPSLDANTAFTDNTVLSGNTYYYVATSVDPTGKESGYSTPVRAVIP
ncbi:MAG TPA: choice-of-anchor D domain-containing protein [Candidatus Sulfotelmatobacter sp.]|nr:choice-of-anchor D domain-containing protein [Candidatus Sulfotelmatobacter sp.]